ncbi:uncharacterized protein LOC119076808 isoform X2 [Bradysia coprophila]|uniref:uncharacterized protein LOC119076808 isoform X2 n=1 Tax=Bradysia coprophila TaxID=38358 RepID=UPI00187DD82A|nr:uncharacterized protein LOC119076808 isoform X2 [Bradysia coprophila]
MSSSGQLILLVSDEPAKEVIYEPVNGTLHVGSDKLKSNVCLEGLRDLAFSIYIDSSGRVCIEFHMKRIHVNGTRVKQHSGRPLHNNTILEAGPHKFIWKYDQRLYKSYSFPSLLLASKSMYEEEAVFNKNRRTMNCLAVGSSNDENVEGESQTNNSKTPEPMPAEASENRKSSHFGLAVGSSNDENVEGESQTNNSKTPEPMPAEASENRKSSTKRRTSLIPVKPNRTSELRRSIVRSKSVCHEPMTFQYRTPKKPIPSAAMAKSVSAIMRSESRLGDNRLPLSARKSLGNFPKMIDGLNLFNVVTDEMRAVGPRKYMSQKFGATSSPKRTPKKALVKTKRLSLRSELTEIGLMRAQDIGMSSEDRQQLKANVTLPSTPVNAKSSSTSAANVTFTPEANASTNVSSVENIIAPEANVTFPGTPEANASPSEKESTNISAVEDVIEPEANVTFTGTPEANVSPSEKEAVNTASLTPELNRLASSSSVEIVYSDDESSDSYSIISVDDDSEFNDDDASPGIIAGMNSESINNDKSTTEDCPEIEQSEQLNTPPEDSSEKSLSGSRLSSISTPTKVLPIRARRNSRPCSLYECCSPSTTFSTPTKSKMANNVVSTPRSILKTPKATKTPKKTVRILEELHEEEDDGPKTNNQSADARTSVTDQFVQNEMGTEAPKISVDSNEVHPESISMDGSDDVFEAIDIKRESTELSVETGTMARDSGIISSSGTLVGKSVVVQRPTPIVIDTPAITELVVERPPPMEVDATALTEMPLVLETPAPMLVETPAPMVVETQAPMAVETQAPMAVETAAPIVVETSTMAEPSDDKADVIDETTDVSGQCGDTDVITETNVDQFTTSANNREETSLFDETFEIHADCSLTSVIDEMQNVDDAIGEKELLNTPKPFDKTNLVGMKELLNTPEALNDTADMRGVRDMLKTPKVLDRTNCVGLKELLNTPDTLNETADMRGVRDMLKTPKVLDRTNCVGLKELLNTPDTLNETADMRGVRDMLKTPKDLDRTNCVGLKELLKTPDTLNETADMRGVRDMLKTPKDLDRTNCVGLKELLHTPDVLNKTADMRGIREMLKTPKRLDQTDFVGVKELLKTPCNRDDTHLEGVNELQKSPDVPVEQMQDLPKSPDAPVEPNQSDQSTAVADKKYKILVKYNSRQSLIALVNSQLEVSGLPILTEQELWPAVAVPAPVQTMAVPVEAVLVEAVPVEAVPVEAVPVEAVPVEAVPVEPVPVEPVPVEPVPVEPVPVKPVPVKPVPVKPVPVEPVPVEPVPVEAEATEAVPVEPVPVEAEATEAVPVEPMVVAVPVDPIEVTAEQEGTNAVETKKEASNGTKTFKSENNQSFPQNETPEPDVEVQASNDNVAEQNEDKAEPSALVNPKTESKFLNVLRKNRNRQLSAIEAQESQGKTALEKDETADATTAPSKVTVALKASKTPIRTRKPKASAVDPNAEDVSEDEDAEEVTAKASKSVRSVTRTRRGKASVAEDKKAAEKEDTKHEKSKIEVKIEKTPSRTRKDEAKATESRDENVFENDETMEATPSEPKVLTRKRIASVPVSQTTVPKSRRRKADQVDSAVVDGKIDSERVDTEQSSNKLMVPKTRNRAASAAEPLESKEKVGSKVASTRKRKATVAESKEENKSASSSTSEFKIPRKRQRQASNMDQQESHDESASESSQVTEADSELLNVKSKATRARQFPTLKGAAKKTSRSTRAAKNESSDMDQQESHDENVSESSQATEADLELLNDHAKSTRSRKRTTPKDPPKKTARNTRAAKNTSVDMDQQESNDESASESSQVTEADSELLNVKSKATRARKLPTPKGPPKKVARSTRAAKNASSDMDQQESYDDNASESSQATEADSEQANVPANVTRSRNLTVPENRPTRAARGARSTTRAESVSELERPTRATSKRTRQMSQSVTTEIGESSNIATTKGRKVSEAEESTSSTATRSRRGQTTKTETPVAGKRPRRGMK